MILTTLHRMTWVCLVLACLGASWFAYSFFLVPQTARFAPDWEGARWVQAANSTAPVAYFRYETGLNVLPDSAFVTVAADQVFRLYVNGTLVGTNALDFTQGNFPRAYMYDVSSFLRTGPNGIALRVANVDGHTPSVRVSLGMVQGTFASYRGTGAGWQATAQSSAVYPRYITVPNTWVTSNFDASSWPPVQQAANPPQSEPLLTVNPLIYERSLIAAPWLSAGAGHDAYFVRQVSLPWGIRGAWLRLVATGTAHIFINGHLFIVWNSQAPVLRQELTDYLSDDEKIVPYRTGLALGVYDISPYLHPGNNTLAVQVSAPGISAAQVGLDTLNAALATDMLISDMSGHSTWLLSNSNWHASQQAVNGWTSGSDTALAEPPPVQVGSPGTSRTFYLPDSGTPRNVQLVPPLLVCEVILGSIGAVFGLWLLISLFIMCRGYLSRSNAFETMSLAYLPAITCEAILIVLSREPQLPQPFPYTPAWGIVLLLLVGLGYFLLWRNARKDWRAGQVQGSPRLSQPPTFRHSPHPSNDNKQFIRLRNHVPEWVREHWALIPLILLAIPLICYNLPYEPYWQDELTSYFAAKGILAHGVPLLSSGFLYPKGELYSYMLALSMLIFGEHDGALRLVTIAEYLLSLPLLYAVGCYFFERKVALIATAMFALSPISLVWGRQVRMYEQAQLLTLLVVYVFYKALREPHRIRLVYLAAVCLLATYLSHEETFIILPAIALYGVGQWMAEKFNGEARFLAPFNKHWCFAAAITAGIISLQLLIVHFSHPPILGTDQSQRPLIQLTANNLPYYIDLLFFPGALGQRNLPWLTLNSVLALAGCIVAVRSTDARAKYCAFFLLVSFMTLVLVFTLASDRYIYPILPLYYLMGAYAMRIGLRGLWRFARSRMVLHEPGKDTKPVPGGYLARSTRAVALLTLGLLCSCVLIAPVLPISNYNLFISQQAGFSYHRHYPDYDTVGQYMHTHWRNGDIVITISPAISILYYVGHVNYFFSLNRALYLFEQNGHIVDTPTGSIALLNQQDLLSVLATHARIWIISDNGLYQAEATHDGRFTFPPDFHIVFEGYGSAIYFRGT